MRPSATRPTSFWRGESGPFEGLSDAPILIAISSQGFLMRSRMRVLFFRQAEMLSLEIWSVSALLLLWFRQPVAAMAWRLQLRLEPMMIACDGFAATLRRAKICQMRLTRRAFIAPTRRQSRIHCCVGTLGSSADF